MDNFKPTFLYIKQHSITGLLYFGKTTKNPEKYKGSGIYWRNHIKKHGKQHVETLWYCLFTEQDTCTDFAIAFSNFQNIVNSVDWANQMVEDGLNGNGSPGRVMSKETREKISKANSGRRYSDEINSKKGFKGELNPMHGVHRYGEDSPHFGRTHSEDTKNKLSEKAKNCIKLTCPYCQQEHTPGNATRWHFDNCKLKPE